MFYIYINDRFNQCGIKIISAVMGQGVYVNDIGLTGEKLK